MRLQRSLIYVLFVVVVVFFLALRYQKMGTSIMWQAPIQGFSGKTWGVAVCKRRTDGSKYLVLKLKQKVPEKTIVLLKLEDHTNRELGRFDGASFIRTIPAELWARRVTGLQLIGVKSGRILAEAKFPGAPASP